MLIHPPRITTEPKKVDANSVANSVTRMLFFDIFLSGSQKK